MLIASPSAATGFVDDSALPYIDGPPVSDSLDGTSALDPNQDLTQYVNCAPGDLLYPPTKNYRLTVYAWGFTFWPFATLAARVASVFANLQDWSQDAAAPIPPAPIVNDGDQSATFDVFSLGAGASVTLTSLLVLLQNQAGLPAARCEQLNPTVQATPARVAAQANANTAAAPTVAAAKKTNSLWGDLSTWLGSAASWVEWVVVALAVLAVVYLVVTYVPHPRSAE